MSSHNALMTIREELALFNIHPSKKFGQNFLLDMNITDKISRLAEVTQGDEVIEIGPGPGGLSRSLLEAGARLTSIEMDQSLFPLLKRIEEAYSPHFSFIEGDALKLDLNSLVEPDKQYKIIANLPYNVATPLLTRWLSYHWPPRYSLMALMFQQEVAERIIAQPAQKAYGRLSILAQWRCDVEIAMRLPPEAFFPPPKVHSAIVILRPKKQIFDVSIQKIEQVTQAIFHQRRKKIRSGLKNLIPHVDAALKELGIDPDCRGETLPVSEFLRIAKYFETHFSNEKI